MNLNEEPCFVIRLMLHTEKGCSNRGYTPMTGFAYYYAFKGGKFIDCFQSSPTIFGRRDCLHLEHFPLLQ